MITTLFGLVVALLQMGKVQGGVDKSIAFILDFAKRVLEGLPADAKDTVSPLVTALTDFLGENAARFDLKMIAAEIVSQIGPGFLGKPDRKAGGGI